MSTPCALGHVAVVSADLDGFRAFYEGTLGFDPAASSSWGYGSSAADKIVDPTGRAKRVLRASEESGRSRLVSGAARGKR